MLNHILDDSSPSVLNSTLSHLWQPFSEENENKNRFHIVMLI